MTRGTIYRLLTLLSLGPLACLDRPLDELQPRTVAETERTFPLSLDKDVDLLFVVDNSGSMENLQTHLAKQFPKLVEALRMKQLAGRIPNVRIGVTSTDLGAGPYALESCEKKGGDGGRLLNQARGSCTPPRDPWIEYREGVTNVPAGAADPIDRVKEAFSCIARLGDKGCAFEQPLEAARRALDPKLKVNSGFLRPDALLVVVFITNEDDCSNRDPSFFDPSATAKLGPLHSFRCFEYGVSCNVNDRNALGPRSSCRPRTASPYLHDVEEYATFFASLKPKGRTLLAAIAGPPDPVTVVREGEFTRLQPSCGSSIGSSDYGDPAVRMKSLIDRFGVDGQFTAICESDFGPALKRLGERIVASLDRPCLGAAPLTRGGGLACNAGDALGLGSDGKPVTCQQGCLELADCLVDEVVGAENPTLTPIPACSAVLFANPKQTDCGGSCPCWRLAYSAECAAGSRSGYAVEILRRGDPPKLSSAVVRCSTLPAERHDPTLGQCL